MSKPAHSKGPAGQGLSVEVRFGNVDGALKALKKKTQREGLFREVKEKMHFIPNTQRRQIDDSRAVKRDFKKAVKDLMKEGFSKDEAKNHLLKNGRSPR